jgi:hypothetical protein
MSWRTLGGEQIENIQNRVEKIVLESIAQGVDLKICIGADSQVYSDVVEMATVIVFIRKGNGGFMFVNKEKLRNNMGIRF